MLVAAVRLNNKDFQGWHATCRYLNKYATIRYKRQ
jgi:hypothetical protein